MIEMLKTVGIFEAKTRLSEICAEVAESGEGVMISRRGEPLVEIRPAKRRSVEPETESEPGILDFRKECETRFGELEDEFEIPRWPTELRFNDRDPFSDYWEDDANAS